MRTDYLTGTCLYLSHLTSKKSSELTDPSQNSAVVTGNVMIHPTATVDPTASIGPNVVIGPNCVVGKGARLQRCVLLENSRVKDHAFLQSAIIGWNSTVGKWVRRQISWKGSFVFLADSQNVVVQCRVEGITVLGDDVNVKDEVYVNGASVLPHKSLSSSILEPAIVMVRSLSLFLPLVVLHTDILACSNSKHPFIPPALQHSFVFHSTSSTFRIPSSLSSGLFAWTISTPLTCAFWL